MIRHLLRVVWNRRRSNALVAIEILLSFLVLAAVSTLVIYYVDNYRRPLGFSYDSVWLVSIDMNASQVLQGQPVEPGAQQGTDGLEDSPAARRARVAQLLQLLSGLPDVEAAAAATNAPYSPGSSTSRFDVKGRPVRFGTARTTDDFAAALRLDMVQGRWFGRGDDGSAWRTVVINQRMARELFGNEDPVGRFIEEDRIPKPDFTPRPRMKVVGVVRDFRKAGELEPASNFVLQRAQLEDPALGPVVPQTLVVRARAGAASAAFEEQLVSKLRAAAPTWTFKPVAMSLARDRVLRRYVPVVAAALLVALFLLMMVALGLTGVLWLSITQRTREIGLRRAHGATGFDIQRQVLGEVLVLTVTGVAAGSCIAIQFPLLEIVGAVRTGVYVAGLAMSTALMFALTAACAWAPGRLASSVDPADALRYE